MITESQVCQISAPDLEMGLGEAASVCPEISPPAPQKVACPGCGKLLSIRVLSEKHHCERKPRYPWKMELEHLLERRKAAAIRRFEKRAALRRTSVVSGEAAVV